MPMIHLNPNSGRLQVILHTIYALITTQLQELLDPNFVNICTKTPTPAISGWDSSKYVGPWYEQAHVIEFDVF